MNPNQYNACADYHSDSQQGRTVVVKSDVGRSTMKKSLMLFLAYLAVTQSAKLDLQEVKVLQQIWEKLGLPQPKNLDRCSVKGGWVTCDCSFEGLTTCHVDNMDLSLNNLTVSILS
ncbi:hypothetical protein HanPSC8_Chr11g0461801 [Helianthus annuus]|nr:hypothetical protein HanPSC8_Chr11g0461801 [Helianthus annuus]